MPRKQRIHYDGALYHVMARGNNGDNILKNDEDKRNYIELIQRYKERYGFKLYAYCIMDNHIHMLVEVKETPLNKIMQGIQLVYTQLYNRKNKRTGHVFQQRYKAVACNKDGYLLHLTKYIHMNPVKAGITEDVNYEWSSYKDYANGKNGFVDIDFVLKILSNSKAKAIAGYKRYMKEVDGDVDQVEYEVTEAQKGNLDKTKYIELDKLIEEILEQEKVTLEQIREKTKKQKISDIRKVLVILAEKNCKTTSTELANKLNISISRISKIRAGEIMTTIHMDE